MNFWRIFDNHLYSIKEVSKLGFSMSEGLRIPDEYLEKQEFVVMRTCHGIGDWGIISAMPRLLKEKYPNCKVYVPSPQLIEHIFGKFVQNWSIWSKPFENSKNIFNNNPYVDDFVDSVSGEIFHDHFRIYDDDNVNIPLVEQILKFWQFEEYEYKDSQPELYWSDEEKELGDSIIKEYIGDEDFGSILISEKFGTQFGIHHPESYEKETEKITKILKENDLPYFYWSYKPIEDTPFNFVNKLLDIRNMNFRIQMYIRCKSKLNVGNQSGALQLSTRYSDTYDVYRQSVLGHNFVRGEICL